MCGKPLVCAARPNSPGPPRNQSIATRARQPSTIKRSTALDATPLPCRLPPAPSCWPLHAPRNHQRACALVAIYLSRAFAARPRSRHSHRTRMPPSRRRTAHRSLELRKQGQEANVRALSVSVTTGDLRRVRAVPCGACGLCVHWGCAFMGLCWVGGPVLGGRPVRCMGAVLISMGCARVRWLRGGCSPCATSRYERRTARPRAARAAAAA
jgi:hypothetical protein